MDAIRTVTSQPIANHTPPATHLRGTSNRESGQLLNRERQRQPHHALAGGLRHRQPGLLRRRLVVGIDHVVPDAYPLGEFLQIVQDDLVAACIRAVAAGVQTKTPVADASRLSKEDVDRAMGWLTKAIPAGNKDAACIRQDTDLDALREREDFKKLLAELEEESTAETQP
jgi:hypothetical protein